MEWCLGQPADWLCSIFEMLGKQAFVFLSQGKHSPAGSLEILFQPFSGEREVEGQLAAG